MALHKNEEPHHPAPPHDHEPHGEHADHKELARLHTEGWYIGRMKHENSVLAHERFAAFMAGFNAGAGEIPG